ncbi:MAG: glutamine synthetase family protein [Actinomycetota bacterium]|nr:glutamine synthetase family protein [Actinomycetota bacterium]
MSTRDTEYVLRSVEERDIRFIRLWFTDVLGYLKSFAITPAELEVAFEEGMGFDGSAIEGFARVQESDMVARPDPSTFQILPWRPDTQGVARMFCDILSPDGEPFPGDPRRVLRRVLEQANEMGYTFYVGPELEYFYFPSATSTEPLDQGGYFDLTPLDVASDLRKRTVFYLESMGISVESVHHEVAPSQHEIVLRDTDALTMADNVMTSRLAVKEVAHEAGVYATFMPKPIQGAWGSGMHTHMALYEGERNAFYDGEDPDRISKVGRAFIAGVLAHAGEMAAVCNQWVNSYKRLVPGYEAPVHIGWARQNRSALLRIPSSAGQDIRVEFRSPDPACNPYLAFAVMLAAGLRGITDNEELPPPAADNIWEMSDAERHAAGIESMPEDLDQALAAMERSSLVRETLGDHVFEFFLRNKRAEWDAYKAYVSPFEIERYLPIL